MDSSWRQEVGLPRLLFSHWTPGLWGPLSTLLGWIHEGLRNTSLSRHRPENGLPPRHTSVIRCKITYPETPRKFMKGEWMTHCSLLFRTNSKSDLGSQTRLWCCGLQMCGLSVYGVHRSSCSQGRYNSVFLPWNSKLDREVLHSHSQYGGVGRELEDKSSAFSSSTFRLCGSGEVTSPLWVCRPHWSVVSIKWVHGCWDLFVTSKSW